LKIEDSRSQVVEGSSENLENQILESMKPRILEPLEKEEP